MFTKSINENLKGVITSLTKETRKELVGKLDQEIKSKEEAFQQPKTQELVLDLKNSIKGAKEVKKELETNLAESEAKIQRLEKELAEAKVRAEQRQKKIEELSQEHSLEEIDQTPLNKKTITFLRAKSIFLNARQETIGELKKCFIALENKFGKHDVIGEVGSIVSGVGGAFDTVTFGIPTLIGETIKASNSFSQIILAEKGNKEFQLSLKDERELVELHEAYGSLVNLIRNSEESDTTNILNLKDRTREGKARAFNTDYEVFSILESKKIWKHRNLTLERMEETISSLSENHEKLESEWEEQFKNLKTKLGKDGANLFYQEQQIRSKIRRLQNKLEELRSSAKDKLKSKNWSTEEKEKRNKERELLLQKFLNNQAAITASERELLEKKITKEELNNLCQFQVSLTNLQRELATLQEQQTQIEIPPKGNN